MLYPKYGTKTFGNDYLRKELTYTNPEVIMEVNNDSVLFGKELKSVIGTNLGIYNDDRNITIDDFIDNARIAQAISASLSKLTKREEQVMRLRFGLSAIDNKGEFKLTDKEIKNIVEGV